MKFFQTRHELVAGYINFFIINCFFCWLIAIKYLFFALPLNITFISSFGGVPNLFCKILVYIFFAFTYFGHFALLVLLFTLPILISIFIFPARVFLKALATIMATTGIMLIICDSMVFSLFRFHLNRIVIDMMISSNTGNDVLNFSLLEHGVFFSLIILIFVVEYFFARWCWKNSTVIKAKQKKFLSFTFGALILSYIILIASAAINVTAFAKQSVVFPWYNTILAQLLSPFGGQELMHRLTETGLTQLNLPNRPLRYPLQPLMCKPAQPLPNILIIVIDSWRFDMLQPNVTPNLYQFAAQTLQFTQHFSGGNATQAGLFSLFYSLPSNYWTAMLEQQRSPIFLDELQKLKYNIKIFASANLSVPNFYKTIFLNIPQVKNGSDGDTAEQRDKNVTKNAAEFLARNPTQPFFSFIFYDSAHAYCTEQTYAKPFQPSIERCNRILLNNQTDPLPYFNRYKNALHFIDGEIATLLKTLGEKKLLENTIVIITGDHGQEFNDNQLNYWEHSSNFTRYQIQTPLIVFWPEKTPKIYHYLTSHYDVVPTLLQEVLHCQNPISDYSIGMSLFDARARPFLLVGSYAHMGIVEPTQITNLLTSGTIEITDLQGRVVSQQLLNQKSLQQALKLLRVFEKNTKK